MTWTIFSRRKPAPEVGVEAEPVPRMTEEAAKAMVQSLVSAATGAAMLDLPPTIYLAQAQHLEREKAKMVAALMTPNYKLGDDCKPFPRWRNVSEYSDPEVVVRIYGEGGEMPLPTWYLCDRCAGLYESLDSLGFCGMLGDNLVQTCREYGQMQRDAGVFRGQMVMAPNGGVVGPAAAASRLTVNRQNTLP